MQAVALAECAVCRRSAVVSLMLPMWGMENLGLLCSRCYARYFDREGASVEVLLWVGWSAQFHGWGMLLGVSVSVSVVS